MLVAAGSVLSYVALINRSNTPCACHVIRDLRTVSGESLVLLKETLLQVSIDPSISIVDPRILLRSLNSFRITFVASDRLVMSVRLCDRIQKHDSYGMDFG